jgi:hypothetical protein
MLVAQGGPLSGKRWTLRALLTIGRDPNCDIVIPDRQVSRHHASVRIGVQGFFIEDMASKNGTHHNGQTLAETAPLQDGDVIQIALAQQFVFLSSDATLPLDSDELPAPGAGRLRLEKRSRRVWIGDEEILPPLSVSQFRLLELLYDNPERVVTRSELVQAVWGDVEALHVSEQALDALVRRLRERLAALDDRNTYIATVRGHGLRLENPGE